MRKILLIFFTLLLFLPIEAQIIRANNNARAVTSGVVYCAEYQAVYDAMTTKPSAAVAEAQNTMVDALVDGGYWTGRMDVFYVLANSTNANGEAYINWVDPGTNDITDPGSTAPTFTALQGIAGDGSSDYLSTNFIPSTDAVNSSLNSTTIGIWCNSNVSGATVNAFGGMDTEGTDANTYINPRNNTIISAYINSTGGMSPTLPANTSIGLTMATRRGATETEAYKDGTSFGTDTDASTALVSVALYLCARNNDGTADRFYSVQISIAFIMNAVSDEDATAIYTILHTYCTAIGI